MSICKGVKKNGEPCKYKSVTEDGFCKIHSKKTTSSQTEEQKYDQDQGWVYKDGWVYKEVWVEYEDDGGITICEEDLDINSEQWISGDGGQWVQIS